MQSLPQLQKFKKQVQTPDEHSQRSDELFRLKQQVMQLQSQLEYVQGNKSFVKKIQNQQCTLCPKLKAQIDLLLKQEKPNRKQCEHKIQEIKKQDPIKLIHQTSQTESIQTFNREIQVELQTQLLSLQDAKQSPLIKQYEEIIIDFHKDYQIKSSQVLQYKEMYEKLKNQYDQFKLQHTNCDDKIKQLKIEINLLKDNNNQYKLPDNILSLKKSIDSTIELNKVNQIVMKTQEGDQQIKKLSQIETDLYVSLRCFRCKELLNQPQTYFPCGHSVCSKCQNGWCERCNKESISYRDQGKDHLLRIYSSIKEMRK